MNTCNMKVGGKAQCTDISYWYVICDKGGHTLGSRVQCETKSWCLVTILCPTVGRSGSFRASRSVCGSRGNVAPAPAPLNQSLSAHPLLPLPPGSDGTYPPARARPNILERKGIGTKNASWFLRRVAAILLFNCLATSPSSGR